MTWGQFVRALLLCRIVGVHWPDWTKTENGKFPPVCRDCREVL